MSHQVTRGKFYGNVWQCARPVAQSTRLSRDPSRLWASSEGRAQVAAPYPRTAAPGLLASLLAMVRNRDEEGAMEGECHHPEATRLGPARGVHRYELVELREDASWLPRVNIGPFSGSWIAGCARVTPILDLFGGESPGAWRVDLACGDIEVASPLAGPTLMGI